MLSMLMNTEPYPWLRPCSRDAESCAAGTVHIGPTIDRRHMHAARRSPTGHCGTTYLHGMDSLARSRRCREPRGGLGRGWAGEHPISAHSPRPGPPLTGQDPAGARARSARMRIHRPDALLPSASGESDVSGRSGWPKPPRLEIRVTAARCWWRHRGITAAQSPTAPNPSCTHRQG